MSITPELNSIIETKIANMNHGEILRSGRSHNDFIEEFSGTLAQAQEDITELSNAGFDPSLMEEYNAILEKMVLIFGERVAAEGSVADVVKQFREDIPKAKDNGKTLAAVVRYLIARTNNTDIKKIYDIIRKGNSQIDTLNDNIAMVNIIRKYPELSSQIKPGGISVDEAFLESVHTQALSLVALKGQADTATDDNSSNIERLNKIISLAVAAEREIKLFADLAFYKDTERYNKNYASSALRERNKSYRDKKDSDTLELN